MIVLGAAFLKPISQLFTFAVGSELYSYILLVPVLVVYLVVTGKGHGRESQGDATVWPLPWRMLVTLLGLGAWLAAVAWTQNIAQPSQQDRLFIPISLFVVLIVASGYLFLGSRFMSQNLLPMSLLAFLVPFPLPFERGLESLLQHGSAYGAGLLFSVFGTPVARQELLLHLPGITLEVAPECSGIRSSLVLFMVSLVAGHLFLNRVWKKTVLAAIVLPLGIARNALRIFTIGMLCVHVDPAMIHSWVHRQGGPLFFALSFVPFFAVLLLLRRRTQSVGQIP